MFTEELNANIVIGRKPLMQRFASFRLPQFSRSPGMALAGLRWSAQSSILAEADAWRNLPGENINGSPEKLIDIRLLVVDKSFELVALGAYLTFSRLGSRWTRAAAAL